MCLYVCAAYHCKCVDPWLTQTKKTCPVCKQRVTRSNPEYSDSSDSDSDGGNPGSNEGQHGASGGEHSERTPLLRPSSLSSGTYDSTTLTTSAQCLAHSPQGSPLLGSGGYYSPDEDTEDTEEEEEEEDHETTQLISRGAIGV